MKKQVVYIKLLDTLAVGHGTTVIPMNHTSDLVSNYQPAWTSPVQIIHPDGSTFETLNSIYRKAELPEKEEHGQQDSASEPCDCATH